MWEMRESEALVGGGAKPAHDPSVQHVRPVQAQSYPGSGPGGRGGVGGPSGSGPGGRGGAEGPPGGGAGGRGGRGASPRGGAGGRGGRGGSPVAVHNPRVQSVRYAIGSKHSAYKLYSDCLHSTYT